MHHLPVLLPSPLRLIGSTLRPGRRLIAGEKIDFLLAAISCPPKPKPKPDDALPDISKPKPKAKCCKFWPTCQITNKKSSG